MIKTRSLYVHPDGSYVMLDKENREIFRDDNDVDYVLIDGTAHYTDENGDPIVGHKRKFFSYINPTLPYDNDTLLQAEAYFNEQLNPISGSGQTYNAYAMPYINLATRRDALNEKLWGTICNLAP